MSREREREHDDKGERAVLDEHPRPVPDVLNNRFKHTPSTNFVSHIFNPAYVAEVPERDPSGLGRSHPSPDIRLRLQLDVEA